MPDLLSLNGLAAKVAPNGFRVRLRPKFAPERTGSGQLHRFTTSEEPEREEHEADIVPLSTAEAALLRTELISLGRITVDGELVGGSSFEAYWTGRYTKRLVAPGLWSFSFGLVEADP